MERRRSPEPTDSQNLNGVVIGNAVTFDLEEEALGDPGRHAVDAFPVEYDRPVMAQIEAARTETRSQENVVQK